MKHLLIILSILLLTSPLFGQSERPETIIIPVSGIGDVSNTRKLILENTLTNELKKHFRIVPQEKYKQVLEQVFEELEYEECNEDTCIMRVQEMLQVENVFNLQIIGEGKDSQLNLKWITLDEKKNEEDYCEGCGTGQLRKMIGGLVEKLVGNQVIEKPVVVVEKKGKGVLYGRKENGKWGWHKSGNEKKNWKYVGEIEDGVPNGQGSETSPYGEKYVGEWKNGEYDGQGTRTKMDGGKYVGEYKNGKIWNGIIYDKEGNITKKYVNGKFQKNYEKKQKGVLYYRRVNGEMGYHKDGDEKWNSKYVGEIVNGVPDGQGVHTTPDGIKMVGEFRGGQYWNTIQVEVNGEIKSKIVNGILYNEDGNILGKFVNGVLIPILEQ